MARQTLFRTTAIRAKTCNREERVNAAPLNIKLESSKLEERMETDESSVFANLCVFKLDASPYRDREIGPHDSP